MMSSDLEQEDQQSQVVSHEEIEASEQETAELCSEQLEEVSGGLFTEIAAGIKGTYKFNREMGADRFSSAVNAIKSGPAAGFEAASNGMKGSQGVLNHLANMHTI